MSSRTGCRRNQPLFFSFNEEISNNYPSLFEKTYEEDEDTGGQDENGKTDSSYGLILFALTFVRLTGLNLLQTLEQPISLVFTILSVEIERVKREQEELKKYKRG